MYDWRWMISMKHERRQKLAAVRSRTRWKQGGEARGPSWWSGMASSPSWLELGLKVSLESGQLSGPFAASRVYFRLVEAHGGRSFHSAVSGDRAHAVPFSLPPSTSTTTIGTSGQSRRRQSVEGGDLCRFPRQQGSGAQRWRVWRWRFRWLLGKGGNEKRSITGICSGIARVRPKEELERARCGRRSSPSYLTEFPEREKWNRPFRRALTKGSSGEDNQLFPPSGRKQQPSSSPSRLLL
ncbi:hypothetical protein DFJ73DRAFT_847134 [Zopfochytrium polystomum]|nr:hypothetical protein DFJ73DRAFT_847134 [Zopfochytrium polystomum]